MSRIFIRISDIESLEGISYKRALEIKQIIMLAFKKKKPQKLTIKEYCEYRGVQESEIIEKLK